MKTKTLVAPLVTIGLLGSMLAAPVAANAQNWNSYSKHRSDQKNQWKNIGIASAAVGVLGLLTHNNTVGLLGLGGAAYSGYRYTQDGTNIHRGYSNNNGYNNGYGDNGYNNNGYSYNGYNNDNAYSNNSRYSNRSNHYSGRNSRYASNSRYQGNRGNQYQGHGNSQNQGD